MNPIKALSTASLVLLVCASSAAAKPRSVAHTPSHPPIVMTGDPQFECVRSSVRHPYDPGPFLLLHHASELRLIVSDIHTAGVIHNGHIILPTYGEMIAGTTHCVQVAQQEGYPVVVSFQFNGSQTPAAVATWMSQVLPLFPHLAAVGFGNEQEYNARKEKWVSPSMVYRRKGHQIVTYQVVTTRIPGTVNLVEGCGNGTLCMTRVPATKVTVVRKARRVTRNVTFRATTAQQYRIDYNASEPIIARLERGATIIFGNSFPLGRGFILSAWSFGGRPVGIGAIGMTGYWTWGIRLMAAFAAYQNLPFWAMENNPNGPGGSTAPARQLYGAEVAEIHAYSLNWTHDDFYS